MKLLTSKCANCGCVIFNHWEDDATVWSSSQVWVEPFCHYLDKDGGKHAPSAEVSE